MSFNMTDHFFYSSNYQLTTTTYLNQKFNKLFSSIWRMFLNFGDNVISFKSIIKIRINAVRLKTRAQSSLTKNIHWIIMTDLFTVIELFHFTRNFIRLRMLSNLFSSEFNVAKEILARNLTYSDYLLRCNTF